MQLNEAITARFRRAQHVRTWQKLLWSNGLASAAKYAMYRSRGYALRQATYRSLELVEIIAISLIASKSIFAISAGLVLVTIFELLIVRGILESLRCFLLTGKRVPASYALVTGLLVTSVTYLSYAALFSEDILLYRELVVFFILKFIASCSSVIAQSLTATIYAFKRVYFPPYLNLLAVGSAVTLAFFSSNVASGGFYVIAGGFVAIRLAMDLSGLFLARKAESSLKNSPDLPIINLKDTAVLLKRVFILTSQFLVPGVAAIVSTDAKPILGAWGTQTVLLAMCSRPFRSIFVDIYHLIQNQLWLFLKYRLTLSVKIAAMILGLVATTLLVICAAFEGFSLIAAVWIILGIASGMYANYLQSIAQDTKVFKSFMIARLSAVALILATFSLEINPIIVALAGETLLLALLASRARQFDVVKSLKFDLFYEYNSDAQIIPNGFIKRFHAGSTFLEKHGFKHKRIILHLRSSRKSEKKMRDFLDLVTSKLRSYDQVVAINSRQVLIWAPLVEHASAITQRLVQAFPIDILDIETKEDEGIARYNKPKDEKRAGFDDLPALAKLGLILSEKKPNSPPIRGSWWVLNKSGLWVSTQGIASPQLASDLYRLYTKSERSIFLNKNFKLQLEEYKLYAFRPFGTIEAVLKVPISDNIGCAFSDFVERYREDNAPHFSIDSEVAVESWAYINSLLSNLLNEGKIAVSVGVERRRINSVAKRSESDRLTTSDGKEFVDLAFSRLNNAA